MSDSIDQDLPRIAVIEDDPSQLDMLAAIIQKLHLPYTTFTQISGIEAELLQFKPDIMLIDVHLGTESGISFFADFKEKHSYEGSVVFLSADTDRQMIEQGMAAGALDFIRKPYGMLELSYKIKNLTDLICLQRKLKCLHEKEKREKERLKKFFPTTFVEKILSGEISTEIGGRVAQVTSMILDLRNSTRIAEYSDPLALANFLSDLFADLADLVFGEGGSINNFRGDGFLATFGAVQAREDDPKRCVQAAAKIIEHIRTINQFKPDWIQDEIKVGIGIATGKVFVGNIGSIHRMDHTVIGDSVNLAARLESLTKLAKVPVLIDGNTRQALPKAIALKRVRLEKVRGKAQEVSIFALHKIGNIVIQY